MGATSVVRKEGRYSGVICRGDLALGKIRLKQAKKALLKQVKEMIGLIINN